MEKLFNWISVACAAIGSCFFKVFGGWDALLCALLLFVILDYFTGLIKAWYTKTISSEIGYKGILKKIMMFIVVAVGCVIGRLTGNFLPLREAVIVFFLVNEALSILENIGEYVPMPESLKEALLQLREKTEIKKGDKQNVD